MPAPRDCAHAFPAVPSSLLSGGYLSRAGEYGVFQIKCATARVLGFEGGCEALSDARTNIEWGLKHLSRALESAGGDLKLAASKHNGGLGRRTLVPKYVNLVFF